MARINTVQACHEIIETLRGAAEALENAETVLDDLEVN